MARYVRSLRDKLGRLVSMNSGVELQEMVWRLMREDDLLEQEELQDLLEEAVRAAATRGSAKSMAALLNVATCQHGGKLDWRVQEYRNIRCLLYESTPRTDHSHQRYSNTVSLYSTSIFTHSHICTINDP